MNVWKKEYTKLMAKINQFSEEFLDNDISMNYFTEIANSISKLEFNEFSNLSH